VRLIPEDLRALHLIVFRRPDVRPCLWPGLPLVVSCHILIEDPLRPILCCEPEASGNVKPEGANIV